MFQKVLRNRRNGQNYLLLGVGQHTLLFAERYWKNLPNLQGEPPIKEILVNGDIEVKEIIKEINKNI